MKRILSALLTLAAAAALVPAVHAHDHDRGCTAATLKGKYGFTFSGFQLQSGISLPFYGAGSGTFDGEGNVSAAFTFSFNGQIGTSPYTATYTVNPDCTGSVTATPGSGGDNFALFIVGTGDEIFAADTTDGETVTADFKRQ